MSEKVEKKISINLDSLVNDINKIFKDILQATKTSDKLAQKSGVKWHERHRLHVLLNIAEESRKKISQNILVAPWFLTELNSIRQLSLRWKDKPVWAELKKSMINKEHFRHTIGKLRVAEHFSKSHKVELVPTGEAASPDLRVQATGGIQAWLYVECYQPTTLSGQVVEPNDRVLRKIVNRAMDKAKKQFSTARPGIIVILTYNQTNKNLNRLLSFTRERLNKTERQYLAGISILHQGVRFESSGKQLSFSSFYSLKFIPNSSYFGNIDFDLTTPSDEPLLITKPMLSITTDDFLKNPNIAFEHSKDEKEFDIDNLHRVEKNIVLNIMNHIKPTENTIFKSKDKKVFPFFVGYGNINYLCGKCNTLLASKIWGVSISNVVFNCPSCDSYNEVENNPEISTPIKGTIGIAKGVYEFNTSVKLSQGVLFFGGVDPPSFDEKAS